MAVIDSGSSTDLAGVGLTSFSGVHTTLKPHSYGALGHYRVAVRLSLIAAQAANSRVFEARNTGTNLIIPTRMTINWVQTAAHTAAILDSLDCFKVTSFSVTDTTNTVTPPVSRKRTSGMGTPPGNIDIRNVTVAGAAAGMTGGTLTKDGSPFHQLSNWLLLAAPTTGPVPNVFADVFDDVNGTHPFVFANNEGFIIENRVLLGAAAGSEVNISLSYLEVISF